LALVAVTNKRQQIYWICQTGGWGLLALGNLIFSGLNNDDIRRALLSSVFIFTMGIGLTHVYRALLLRWKWKQMSMVHLLPRILPGSLIMSLALLVAGLGMNDVLSGQVPFVGHNWGKTSWINLLSDSLNFTILFIVWNVLYFAVHTFENWKKEEIINLELRAAKMESELTSFRAQMNPHFIFNSLNSIKALVDENPGKAREAIMMLSSILRNNMMPSKSATVLMKDEWSLVEKYLQLEKIRFEDRLNVRLHLQPEFSAVEVPSFMLQTLVENAIKHGISKRVEGGDVEMSTSREGDRLRVDIYNTGTLRRSPGSQGIGLLNTQQRLALIYGDRAELRLTQQEERVLCSLFIPIQQNMFTPTVENKS
jgi:two-component system, LytTR family, sensor kinase